MSQPQRQEMEDTQDEGSSRLAWFLTGAAIGVTVALLYAPKSGRQTRDYLTEKSRETFGEGPQSLIESARDVFERGRQLVEDAADLFERGRKLVKG
jgi:gas vesicle protein